MINTIDATVVEQDWRFAELVARTWAEPALVDRYAADPCSVLAEFGIKLTNRREAPALARPFGSQIVVERLDSPAITMNGTTGFCVNDADTDDSKRVPVPALPTDRAA
ncbi:MAG TPA: hypothetical protein VGM10_03870 [Actinocrinis sp.]|jgi:putative thiazole/oxazole-modified microcin (TOMM)-like peptide